jgi:hypothetical protein
MNERSSSHDVQPSDRNTKTNFRKNTHIKMQKKVANNKKKEPKEENKPLFCR